MNISECMEYAQLLCIAQTSSGRNDARKALRSAIAATVAAEVAAERARWTGSIDVVAIYGGKDGRRDWVSAGAWLNEGDVIAVLPRELLV